MSAIDHSDIDGRLLQLLLAVTEERSVTRAAVRLDVTQSAVSHQLDRLRAITGDPLFVKSGRGIVPTARAEALALQARRLLDELRAFAQGGSFDPAAFAATTGSAAAVARIDELRQQEQGRAIWQHIESLALAIQARVASRSAS